MGRTHDPLFIRRDPNAADFGMPELSPGLDVDDRRLSERRTLVSNLGGTSRFDRSLQDMESFQAKAFDFCVLSGRCKFLPSPLCSHSMFPRVCHVSPAFCHALVSSIRGHNRESPAHENVSRGSASWRLVLA